MGYQEEEIFCKELFILPCLPVTAKIFSLFVCCFSDFEARLTNLVFTPLLIPWRAAPPEQCATCMFFSSAIPSWHHRLSAVMPCSWYCHLLPLTISFIPSSIWLCLSSWEATDVPFLFAPSCHLPWLHTTHFILPLGLSTVCACSIKLLSLSAIKTLRLPQYVCIGRYVYAHKYMFHLSRPCHLPHPLWWQVFWEWHFGDSCWHMQTSAIVKGKEAALEKKWLLQVRP